MKKSWLLAVKCSSAPSSYSVANDGTLLAAPSLQNARALIKGRGMPLLEYQTRGQLDAGVETASISIVCGD